MIGQSAMEYRHALQRKWPPVSFVILIQKYASFKKCIFCCGTTEPKHCSEQEHGRGASTTYVDELD